jgi:peptidoglycan L-alanyl-D-glutamate endopeptidase CwlK
MRDISQLHPTLQQKAAQLINICEKNGLRIGIGECVRTIAEQDALYQQGRTTAGKIVTNARGSSFGSQHQWGIAFDFYRNDGMGAFHEAGQFFERVGALGKTIGLGWGGDWVTIKDRPHFYLSDWGSTTTKLKSQYGLPNTFMATWRTISPVPIPQPSNPTQQTSDQKTSDREWIKRCQKIIGAKIDGISGPETLIKSPLLKIGMKHPMVVMLQVRWNTLGFWCGDCDGIFGQKTKQSTQKFQATKGLIRDGIVGPQTWKKIYER